MRIIRLLLVVMMLSILTDTHAARMSDYTDNTTPNADVYFIGVDPNDTSQTVRGSNYRYTLDSILGSGLLDATFKSLTVSGTGDSWLELENNTSFTDSLTGKYGLRFYNGALQQIINGAATDIGSASVIQRSSDPVYTDLSTGQIAVSTSSGDLFIKTSTGMYTFAGSYAADPTPPTFASASIAADGVTVTTGFAEAVSQGAGYSDTHFNLDASTTGNDIGLTYVSGSGTNSWTFTAASTILQDETVNLDFSGVSDSVEDGDGTDLASVTDYSVTNNSEQTAGPVYLINEDFSGTGTPSGWSVVKDNASCIVDFDYGTPEKLRLVSPVATSYNSRAVTNSYTSSSVVHLKTIIKQTVTSSDDYNQIVITSDGSIAIRTYIKSTGTINMVHGTAFAYGSANSFLTGTTYYIWIDATAGSGANGTAYLYISTVDSKPGSPTLSITTGTWTSNFNGMYINTNKGAECEISLLQLQ